MSYALHATKKYSMFEAVPFNREVRRIKGLRESMKRHGFIAAYPLHVTRNGSGKLKIKAGHHRFEVAQELGLPVYYVICDDDAGVFELEHATVHWTLADYMHANIQTGSAEHIAVRQYAERTGINVSQAASMLAGQTASSGNCNKKLKNGTYKLGDPRHAEMVADLVLGCKSIGIDFATHPLFVSALSLACFIPEFDSRTFLHRVAKNPGLAKKQATRDDYLAMVDAIYNHGAKSRTALAFLAKEAARERAIHVAHAKPKGK